MVLITYFQNHFRCTERDIPRDQLGGIRSESNPLLSQKDDDNCDSDSEGEDDAQAGVEPKPVKDDEDSHRFCAICFEAPKDCFFIPCGHCVACFGCATR